MNKVATLGLAFLLVFSGCLGFGEEDIPELEETVEPVGETDLEGLEHDVNLLTARLDAEEAKLASLETKVNGMTDAPDVLEALGCREDEIARYTGFEWVCSDDRIMSDGEVLDIVSNDLDNLRTDMDNLRTDMDAYATMSNITMLMTDIQDISSRIDNLDSQVNDLWDVIYNMELRISELESDLENATSCQLVPFGNCAGADLSGMNLSGMDLNGTDLRGANLYYANLANANLQYADLTDANLRYADLTDATLSYADLKFTNLEYATVTDADFAGTYWHQTIWTDGTRYDSNQAD